MSPEVVFVDEMIARFRERAEAIRKNSSMPPLEGLMRKRWIDQRNIDFQDFMMLSDAVGFLVRSMVINWFLTFGLRL